MNPCLARETRCSFDVYGYRFSIRSSEPKALDGLREDFAFFSSAPAAGGTEIELICGDPPRDGLPGVDASVYTPRNVVYRQGTTRYIDYHGRGMGILDETTGHFSLYSRDPDLLYEATYLFLLSRIGEELDRRKLHRIHALGVEIGGRAVLALLPMGGGKSTLAMHLLAYPRVRLISDDSPWIDREGRSLAFPLRIGLLPGSENSVPPEHRRVIQRMEFGPKHLVNFGYFRDRVCPSADPGIVFIGRRTLSPECRIEEIGMTGALSPVIVNCVIGMGLFQGLEFLLHSSALELAKKAGLGISRMRNCLTLLRRSRVCVVHLGRDSERNAAAVMEYADKVLGE